MSELKPCPFCGEMPKVNDWTLKGIFDKDVIDKRCFCENGECPVYLSKTIAIDDWNTRPIEDALNKRVAELSQAVGLITTLKPTMLMDTEHPLDMAKEVAEYVTARIAELEAEKECEMRVFKDGNAWCFVLPDFQDLQVSSSVWMKEGVLDKIYKELRSVRNEREIRTACERVGERVHRI